MLDGVMLLWFGLGAAAIAFVAIDIRATPESPVLKWGFVLLTAYTGPLGAFLYVLGCREPLPGLHEQYVAQRWRQVLGSTMHCVAGDGLGILAGAVIVSFLALPHLADIAVEYLLGFGFGWTIFQALFMRDMAGGSYRRALVGTFVPEFVSMNFLMAGMVPVATLGRRMIAKQLNPGAPEFWFVMSMALLAGFIVAYPVNWWLVARGLKHGMMTVRRPDPSGARASEADAHFAGSTRIHPGESGEPAAVPHAHQIGDRSKPSAGEIAGMSALSVAALALAIWGASAIRAG